MDLRFDSKAALDLIKHMDIYYKDMGREIKHIITLTERSSRWNDDQNAAFFNNIKEIVEELKETIKIQVDYRNTYYDRVKELRE
ncbi:MAG: hypothetical protein IJ746_04420 [Ruminococcus sp.]|nr:hypothetical protein [Ruminococcus sp.]